MFKYKIFNIIFHRPVRGLVIENVFKQKSLLQSTKPRISCIIININTILGGSPMQTIALATDHGGFELMKAVRAHLESKNVAYKDFGTETPDSCNYPEIALPAAKAIVSGECGRGIFICGTGIGISIAANKVPGIRAALCTNVFMAQMSREHNDANVLVLGGRVTDEKLACDIVDMYLNTDFSKNERHRHRVELLNELDRK